MNAVRRAWMVGLALLVLAVFTGAALATHELLASNLARQQQLREAQTLRAQLLRLQLDEETGVRGFVAARDPVLLEPYRSALRRFPATQRALQQLLAALGIDDSRVRAEAVLNARWNATVALPLLIDRQRGVAPHLELRGKALVDRLRVLDAGVFAQITQAASQADRQATVLIDRTLAGGLVAGVLVMIVVGAFATAQLRLSADLERQRRAYEEEKRIADMLQEAFMRTSLPAPKNLDLHATYVPAGLEAKVGGDWYDAFELAGRRILFSIGDVAGHGIDAAVVMSRVRQAIVSVGIAERDPAAILARVNEILLLQDELMVTAICGFIDVDAGEVSYATAGHPPMMLVRASGNVEILPYSGPPLGVAAGVRYRTFTAFVEPGATLVLYTDGLVEQGRNLTDGEARLVRAIAAVGERDPLDPAAALLREVLGSEIPVDDVAILTVSFRDLAKRVTHAPVERRVEA
jgi:serine phosphatase RsbU (regulator of sigma subunit)